MIPVLYSQNETAYTSNGVGRLADAISCKVREVLNGEYEATITMPIDGMHAIDVDEGMQFITKPNDFSSAQPFRIYKISKNANKHTMTINAQHISYDLCGIPVSPFTATGVVPTMTGLKFNSMIAHNFTFWTSITNTFSQFTLSNPQSVRSCLGGVRGSVLDTFLGEYEWDKYIVKLHAHRGSDRGVTIRYGKNLKEFQNERTNESFYTGCISYWESEDDRIYGSIQYIQGHENFTEKIMVLDASAEFEEKPTAQQLNTYSANYIVNNNIGNPFKDSLKVDFVPLWQTEEYKDIAPLERVGLGDTVHVVYNGMNIAMKVTEYTYDSLQERYENLKLGTKKQTLQQAIADPLEKQIAGDVASVSTSVGALTNTVGELSQNVSGLSSDVSGLQSDVGDIQTDVSGLQTDVGGIQSDVGGLQSDVSGLQTDVGGIQTDVGGLQTDVSGLQTDVDGIQTNVDGLQTNLNDLQDSFVGAVSSLEEAIETSSQVLSGGTGGYVYISKNAAGQPNEILIMDEPTREAAINVLRLNKNGIGFSTTGYSGTYRNAWDITGNLNADFINSGEINGNLIRASSILTNALEVNAYNAVNGSINNVTYDGDGMHIARKDANGNIVSDYQSLFTELGMRVVDKEGNITLQAEKDTVEAINFVAHNFLKVQTSVQETGTQTTHDITDRFQGYWSVVHNKPMVAVFWEET